MNAAEPISRSIPATARPLRSLHAGFVLTGMVTTLLGPILPSLSARWRLDDLHAGLLFTAQFSGSVVGVLLSSLILTRRGYRACLVPGFVCMGVGVMALVLGSWTIGMISTASYGLGLGLTIPATNLLVAEANPRRSAAALSLLNLAWGLGAVLFPLLAAEFQRMHHLTFLLVALGAAALLFALWLGATVREDSAQEVAKHPREERPPLTLVDWQALVILGLLFFLYVGTENGVGGWVASYARRTGAGSATSWALVPSFFWGALLAGRALAPLVLREGNEIRLARAGVLAAALGGVVVLFSSRFAGIAGGSALAGLGLSAVFPITIARLSFRFGREASRFVGPMFALGGLGGATLPWLIGFVSDRFGGLREGLWIPVLCSLVMFALYLSRSLRRAAPAA
jgi:FHS family glucose/mannose:H+ symporter-like MFS transporter